MRKCHRRAFSAVAASLLGAALTGFGLPALAADYTGPVKVLVGFPPGGATDVVARVLADKLKDVLNQPVLVDNKGGAGGMIATITTSRATPGNTLIQYLPDIRYCEPLEISRPSEGEVGGNPRPRNDKVASNVIADATCSAVTASSGVRQLGSRCLKMMRGVDRPRQVAASMYSLRRSTSAMDLAERA